MTRALVLGGGGVTGIAWEAGVLDALADSGVDVASAELVIGTSAGSIVGALLAGGHLDAAGLATTLVGGLRGIGTADLRALGGLAAGQFTRDREAQVRRFGRSRHVSSGLTEDEFVERAAGHLVGQPWPARLVVTAVDAASGRPVAFDASCGFDLGRVVAASCAVPGVFPAVHLGGVPHLDGGVHTPANAHLAATADRIIALAPFHRTHPHRRPDTQLAQLDARWLLLHPDAPSQRALGRDPLSETRKWAARDAGRRQGAAVAERARRVWNDR